MKTKPDFLEAYRESDLFRAVRCKDLRKVEELLMDGANPNEQRPCDGYTPLHCAVVTTAKNADDNSCFIVDRLLIYGADPEHPSKIDGLTPITLYRKLPDRAKKIEYKLLIHAALKPLPDELTATLFEPDSDSGLESSDYSEGQEHYEPGPFSYVPVMGDYDSFLDLTVS
ncbi:MAG: hypothetical protein Tsb006_0460 [Rickettsiaceae bacterium]